MPALMTMNPRYGPYITAREVSTNLSKLKHPKIAPMAIWIEQNIGKRCSSIEIFNEKRSLIVVLHYSGGQTKRGTFPF